MPNAFSKVRKPEGQYDSQATSIIKKKSSAMTASILYSSFFLTSSVLWTCLVCPDLGGVIAA